MSNTVQGFWIEALVYVERDVCLHYDGVFVEYTLESGYWRVDTISKKLRNVLLLNNAATTKDNFFRRYFHEERKD